MDTRAAGIFRQAHGEAEQEIDSQIQKEIQSSDGHIRERHGNCVEPGI